MLANAETEEEEGYFRQRGVYDMIWIRGDDVVIEVEILDGSYQPIDITGWDFQATCKELPKYEEQAIFMLEVGSGIVITEPTEGKLVIQVPREQTKKLALNHVYYFDLVGITSSNQRITVKVWQVYVGGGTSVKGI